MEIFEPLVRECDLDPTKNLNHKPFIPKLSKNANDGLANVHLDHSVLRLLKGILRASLGLEIQSKKGSETVMW